jgi:short-subunit dehydrogenase
MNISSFEYIYCDLSNEESIENTWKTLIQKYREIHILINNAAIARG